jgi:hypothetical protein
VVADDEVGHEVVCSWPAEDVEGGEGGGMVMRREVFCLFDCLL